jgi:hypothetical protein
MISVICTVTKKTPIHILCWFINNLHQEKCILAPVWVDKNGTLAGFSALNTTSCDETELNLETTDRYASFLNGKVKRKKRTLSDSA